jgi:predicted secreted Zn-dependent protease
MGITAKRGAVSEKTYTVNGKTLEDINNEISKKGPTDPNESKKYAGSCLGEIAIKLEGKDVEFETKQDGSNHTAIARLKSGLVTSTSVITTPKLGSDKGLSDPAKKEWKRFLVMLGVHERGHADSYYALAVTVAHELMHMSGEGSGTSEKLAKGEALKQLYGSISKKYSKTAIENLVKADAKAYDAKNKHGESQGAVLDASIA